MVINISVLVILIIHITPPHTDMTSGSINITDVRFKLPLFTRQQDITLRDPTSTSQYMSMVGHSPMLFAMSSFRL